MRVELASRREISQAWSGPRAEPRIREVTLPDGCRYRIELGQRSDHLLIYGRRSEFHISSDLQLVLCAPTTVGDPAWQRFLLDTVLATTSLLSGFEALHASAVRCGGGVAGFMAPTGGGKTSLAAELVRRGFPLFCDDVLTLRHDSGGILAHPGPPLMNLPLDGPHAEDIGGTVVARLDGEAWVELRERHEDPQPVTALFILDRGGTGTPALEPLGRSSLTLLPHAIRAQERPERMRSSFTLIGELAERTAQYRLRTGDADPKAVADLVEGALERYPSRSRIG